MDSYQKLTLALTILIVVYPLIALSGGKGFRTQCSKDSDCDASSFLECNLNYYACDCPKSTAWNSDKQTCLTMEGRPCDLHHHRGPNCVSNSTCTSGRCSCDDGYLRNGFGVCELGYDMPCEGTEGSLPCSWRYMLKCHQSLNSLDKKCKCQGESVDYIWDEDRMKCVSLVGTGCDLPKDSSEWSDDKLECVKGGHCVQEVCECLPGHSITPQRTCLLKYGEKCDNQAGALCNKFSLLNCQDGVCRCEFFGQMSLEGEVCRMLAGEFCDLPTATENLSLERNHQCVQDAECLPVNHHSKGKCTCLSGKLRTPERACTNAKGHGLPCSFAGDCDSQSYLTCVIDEDHGGHCDCLPNEMFINGTDCFVLPGRSCSCNKKCGRNSNCENGEYCICNEGYVLDPIEFNCYLPQAKTEVEEPVIQNQNQLTSPIVPKDNNEKQEEVWTSWNECSKMPKDSLMFERCDCSFRSNSHLWSQDKQKCLGLVGSVCQVNESCVDYAYCDSFSCQCHVSAKTTLERTCLPKRSNIGHQPYHQGHRNALEDGSELSRTNPVVLMATGSGGVGLSLGSRWQFFYVLLWYLWNSFKVPLCLY